NESRTKSTLQPLLQNADWSSTLSVWNQDEGINSNQTDIYAFKNRIFFIKAFHNMLPTLQYLKIRKSHVYKNNICYLYKSVVEDQIHLWTCPTT
ncbi:11738_t:CDS:1, partial [Ambispora leptoticha]